jgi:tetratricopeptide (TPR) repeat protein
MKKKIKPPPAASVTPPAPPAPPSALPPSPLPPPPLDVHQTLVRAHAHWSAGQADQAEQLCQQVIAVWPGQTDAMHLLGLMAHAFGNLDLAIEHLRLACKAPRAPAIYFSNLAEMCRLKGLLTEGEEAGRRAVALDASLAGAWNNLGILQQEAGKFEESRVSLERVVALQPDSPEAHNNLGNTYKRMGDLGRARLQYGKAIELRPEYSEAYSNLASLLNDHGECEAAAAAARRSIEINPQMVDAYLNLASIEITRSRPAEALRWLNSLASFAPLHAGAWNARARTLKQLDQLDEALAAARQAVALAPHSADSHNTLGQILQHLGRNDEALAAFERAIHLPGVAAEDAMLSRAAAFLESGLKEESMLGYERAAKAFPASVKAIFARSEVIRYESGDPDLERLENYLSHGDAQPLNDRTAAHFALGKAYLDADEPARAFEHLRLGSKLKRGTFQYDAAQTAAWIASIAETFSGSLMKRLAGSGGGEPSSTPIFVVGMPRSGTTLVEQILASHPLAQGAGELSALRQVAETAGPYPASALQLTGEALTTMGRQYMARIAPLVTRSRLVDKMPANFLYTGFIRLILPNARIIHCRRNAADTCLSSYTKLFASEQLFSYDLGELGRFYMAYEQLMAHWRALLPADRFFEVHYEDVVDDLPGQARRMVEWLGLPWDESCLRFHETQRVIRTASLAQVRQPIYSSSKGRWRRYAPFLAPLLTELGMGSA